MFSGKLFYLGLNFLFLGFGSCAVVQTDPAILYNQHRDTEALLKARDQIGSRHDLYARTFLSRYYLVRYIVKHNDADIQELRRSRGGEFNHLTSDEGLPMLEFARFMNAAVSTFANDDVEAAKRTLKDLCPGLGVECLTEKAEFWGRNADARGDRASYEAAFVFYMTLHHILGDPSFEARALPYLVYSNPDLAEKMVGDLAATKQLNADIAGRYCEALAYASLPPDKALCVESSPNSH